jgi:drug/metabolite transporter (DMT)-like permease
MILIILLYLICACTFTIAKATLAFSQPIFYVGVRMIVAGILLLGITRFFKGMQLRVKTGDWGLFAQIMIFNIYCAYVLDLWSLHYITSIESSLVFNLSPFAAAIFSYLWFSERLTTKKCIGLGIGSLSIVPLLFARTGDAIAFDTTRVLPLIMLIISVVASAYGWIVMRELIKVRDYSPLFVNAVGMLGGGFAALLTSYAIEPWSPSPVTSWHEFIIYTLAMIVIANFIFSNLYSYLLKKYTATLLSFAGFLCPIFAALLGSIFLDEPLSWRFFFSLVTATVGLSLFYTEELRQGYIAKN